MAFSRKGLQTSNHSRASGSSSSPRKGLVELTIPSCSGGAAQGGCDPAHPSAPQLQFQAAPQSPSSQTWLLPVQGHISLSPRTGEPRTGEPRHSPGLCPCSLQGPQHSLLLSRDVQPPLSCLRAHVMGDGSLQRDEAFLPNAFSYNKNKGKNNICSIQWFLQCLVFWSLALFALKAEQVLHEMPSSLGP